MVLEILLQHRCGRVHDLLPPETSWVAAGRIAVGRCLKRSSLAATTLGSKAEEGQAVVEQLSDEGCRRCSGH